MDLRFLGQSGVRIESGTTVVYVDPYLSDHVEHVEALPERWRRRFAPPLDPAAIDDADAVLCTHEHGDHLDPRTLGPLLAASPRATLLVPATARAHAMELTTADRIVVARGDGDVHELGELRVYPVPAAHGSAYAVEPTPDGHRWLGYVIEGGGRRVYHAGDTVSAPEVVGAVSALGTLDAALLPINGRDAYRDAMGIVGNLWPREAVELALELGARTLVPLHHDLFAWNGITTAELHDYVRRCGHGLEITELRAGESLFLSDR